ncbi:MAG: DUF4263 domain-containing protein [Patescibacteria group bacterium]|nr:DUF4263 domain-containing protein [Patescibacteria group bacterium]
MFDEFPAGLRFRRGRKLLQDIEVYHDFSWKDVFPTGRTAFRNCKSLASRVRSDCPDGRKPALLLTIRDEAREVGFTTDTHYVLPVRIRAYLQQHGSDAASTYFTGGLCITRPDIRQALEEDKELRREVVQSGLDIDAIRTWIAGNDERLNSLRVLVEHADGSTAAPDAREPASIATVLEALDALDPATIDMLVRRIGRIQDPSQLGALLDSIADTPSGRIASARSLGDKLADRIADVRATAAAYTALLNYPASTETDLQHFLEENPWLLGLDYLRVRPKASVPRGALDFILERYDGHQDILELKGPNEVIIEAPPMGDDGVPPSPSRFRLGSALSHAIPQALLYRDSLDGASDTSLGLYGLKHARNSRLIIVVGRASTLSVHAKRALELLNLSLHRIEVVPYDLIAHRAEANVKNLERLLGTSPGGGAVAESTPPDDAGPQTDNEPGEDTGRLLETRDDAPYG